MIQAVEMTHDVEEFEPTTTLLKVRRPRRLTAAQAREAFVAFVYLVALATVAVGVGLAYVPAGVIAAGLGLGVWAYLVFAVAPDAPEAPTGDA